MSAVCIDHYCLIVVTLLVCCIYLSYISRIVCFHIDLFSIQFVSHYSYSTPVNLWYKIQHWRRGPVVVVMVQFGQLSEFDTSKEDWIQYAERLTFFMANSIVDEDKKRAIFLTVIGLATFRHLKSLISPEKPEDFTFKDLVEKSKEHYCPAPSAIVQRFKFNTRVQQPGVCIDIHATVTLSCGTL